MRRFGCETDGFAQRSGRFGQEFAACAARFRPRTPSRSRRAASPPGASSGHSAAQDAPLLRRPNAATSDLRRSHLPSGCRRTMPDAVHGTSARMRSNGAAIPPAGRLAGVAGRPRGRRARRAAGARGSRERARSRASSRSSAVELDVGQLERGAWSCRRARRRRRARACRRAARAAAPPVARPGPAPQNAPSAKPGSAVTGRGGSTMMPSAPAGARADALGGESREQRVARADARD